LRHSVLTLGMDSLHISKLLTMPEQKKYIRSWYKNSCKCYWCISFCYVY